MEDLFYTSERNVQIVISLLKANGIKKVIASPGTTNYTFVGSIQNDPWFEIYSSVDERSAAYIACGLAAESGESVVLTCTGSTASRNYLPGLTEAYYRKLPVLAITSHQGKDRIGQLIFQNIDRSNIPNDVAKLSVELPIIKDERDEAFVTMEVNKAILELRRNGNGPVHINIFTTYSRDFSIKEIPPVRVMKRIHAWDNMPKLPNGNICIYVGSHVHFSKEQEHAIDQFCGTHDAIVICDHTSGYYGKYRLLPTLSQLQNAKSLFESFDLMIHIGEISAATFAGTIPVKEIWRVSTDGELRDPFKKLSTVFQMPEEFFFKQYSCENSNKHNNIDKYHKLFNEIYNLIPELPFSNIWTASQLSKRLPKGSLFHISASNSRRCWNMFHLPEGVQCTSNVGCCGIDGCTSSMIGSSLANPNRLCFLVTGDLAFFYDLNSLANRHVGRNIRILLINNAIGAEFKLSAHFCYKFGNEADKYMAAAGHYGAKSPTLVKHFTEDLGFQYLSATNKEEFIDALDTFTNPQISDKPIILEVFTNHEDENEALKLMTSIIEPEKTLRTRISKSIRSVAGEKGVNTIKTILGKK
ncbi:MAG: 2-succinyl-5-enolpyruvyl-6-hydroxy-3-cyclohexene-1-carboxylate synthase [Muribaculaceae bacterium]|nr:2-succinyl-5-enolpyruvyl-6-hydroxy-3-cyclohexene-1-carboxylate synthase [Muribaculaceae bacterium]